MSKLNAASPNKGGGKFRIAHWRIHVTTASGRPVPFRFAIGFDQTLELIEERTPYDFKFDAAQFTALMTLDDPEETIVAELYSDLLGEFQKTGGFSGGDKGKFTHHPLGPTFSSAGSGF